MHVLCFVKKKKNLYLNSSPPVASPPPIPPSARRSPEMMNEGTLTPKADVYSFGVL
jgi:hypothetical protein